MTTRPDIGLTFANSRPVLPSPTKPDASAPNVVVVVLGTFRFAQLDDGPGAGSRLEWDGVRAAATTVWSSEEDARRERRGPQRRDGAAILIHDPASR